ncbi:DUF1493 family protein [Salmonella enterica]|nr:DUF1493 family protein [Salmonella enterica]EHL9559897.1 DUF1493 family protein [Salmonella enterica subsp. enterica serovar Altona]EIZ0165694.1 DUF1493 family protein [Salmonella enterica subsp. enterica]MDI8838432.1 DUF1493 family protein [Salmonella enterica subsp. enterica serovar Anatum]EHK2300045.1 DUF1493 family protein [Salmonella enterica]EHK5901399.1 DUF1493 family protein [Salmonella enterica]
MLIASARAGRWLYD